MWIATAPTPLEAETVDRLAREYPTLSRAISAFCRSARRSPTRPSLPFLDAAHAINQIRDPAAARRTPPARCRRWPDCGRFSVRQGSISRRRMRTRRSGRHCSTPFRQDPERPRNVRRRPRGRQAAADAPRTRPAQVSAQDRMIDLLAGTGRRRYLRARTRRWSRT